MIFMVNRSKRTISFLVLLLSIAFVLFLSIVRPNLNRFTPSSSLSHTAQLRQDATTSHHIFQNTISHKRSIICGKKVSNPSSISSTSAPFLQPPWTTKNKSFMIVIGDDNMHHVQTNNHINAILHAMDYAMDHNASLALIRNGWAVQVLRKLFRGDEGDLDIKEWEAKLESNLDVIIFDRKEHHDYRNHYNCTAGGSCPKIQFMSGDEMYYYHTTSNLSSVMQRRDRILNFLWSHPTTSTSKKSTTSTDPSIVIEEKQTSNMCSAISKSLPEQYVVIHSRWMKKNGCLKRLARLAHWIKNKTNVTIDHEVPCTLPPNYIESILRSRGALHYPIYVISDGLNTDIIRSLQNHSIFGNNVKTVPQDISWVGGDMMLGVLSSVFIGTPISTLSGNIARARVALGSDPKTNILSPKLRTDRKSEWINSCEDPKCLYDVRFLNHYVG
mmetsp:Transcript_5487/g.10461  ORF Transcript_5487/g.10461 Transcript_5487/m.10461 type:complete len:442 (-) Transcript_5487:1503-2828(-)